MDDDFDPDDPFDVASANAPADDEPFPERQRLAAEAAWQEYLRGEATPVDEIRRELLGDVKVGRSSAA